MKCFIIPCLWKVIFLWDFRICLVFMNTEVIFHVIPCGVVPSYWHFGGAVIDHFMALKMNALYSSRTLVTLYHSAWININEDLNYHCSVGCVRHLPNLSNEIPSLVCGVYEACTLVPLSYSLCCVGKLSYNLLQLNIYTLKIASHTAAVFY